MLAEQAPLSCAVAKRPCPSAKASCPTTYRLRMSATMRQLCVRCASGWSWDAASAQCVANSCPAGSSMIPASSEEAPSVKQYYCGGDDAEGLTLQQALTLAVCSA